MDFIFEFIVELLFEGSMEISTNKKIRKWIRYPILAIIILFFVSVIFGILIVGISLFKENVLAALFMIFIGLAMLIGSIVKFREIYIKEKKQ